MRSSPRRPLRQSTRSASTRCSTFNACAVIEAMMAGVPVVGTTIAAEGIGMTDGVEALIADDPDAFAEAVARLYRDRSLWETVRANGRHLVETSFSMETMRAATNEVVEFGPAEADQAAADSIVAFQ